MKSRQGFISNSSTASFIIKVLDNETKNDGAHGIYRWSSIRDLISFHMNGNGDNDYEDRKDVIYQKLFSYSGDGDNPLKKKLDSIYDELRKDEQVVLVTMNMHLPIVQDLIRYGKNIEIIEEWQD